MDFDNDLRYMTICSTIVTLSSATMSSNIVNQDFNDTERGDKIGVRQNQGHSCRGLHFVSE